MANNKLVRCRAKLKAIDKGTYQGVEAKHEKEGKSLMSS
jgi:hypothetical protein